MDTDPAHEKEIGSRSNCQEKPDPDPTLEKTRIWIRIQPHEIINRVPVIILSLHKIYVQKKSFRGILNLWMSRKFSKHADTTKNPDPAKTSVSDQNTRIRTKHPYPSKTPGSGFDQNIRTRNRNPLSLQDIWQQLDPNDLYYPPLSPKILV